MSATGRLTGASITVSASIEPAGAFVSPPPPGDVRHVLGFTPTLDEAYLIRAVLSSLHQRVAFVHDHDHDHGPTWQGDAYVKARTVLDEPARDGVKAAVVAGTNAAAGEPDTLQAHVVAVKRQDKFTGQWINLDESAPAASCRVTVDCVIGG